MEPLLVKGRDGRLLRIGKIISTYRVKTLGASLALVLADHEGNYPLRVNAGLLGLHPSFKRILAGMLIEKATGEMIYVLLREGTRLASTTYPEFYPVGEMRERLEDVLFFDSRSNGSACGSTLALLWQPDRSSPNEKRCTHMLYYTFGTREDAAKPFVVRIERFALQPLC